MAEAIHKVERKIQNINAKRVTKYEKRKRILNCNAIYDLLYDSECEQFPRR